MNVNDLLDKLNPSDVATIAVALYYQMHLAKPGGQCYADVRAMFVHVVSYLLNSIDQDEAVTILLDVMRSNNQ